MAMKSLGSRSLVMLLVFMAAQLQEIGADTKSYWDKTTGESLPMPEVVQKLESPLSTTDATKFEQLIREGRLLGDLELAAQFCKAANLACSPADVEAAIGASKQSTCQMFYQVMYGNHGRRGRGCSFTGASEDPTEASKRSWFTEEQLTSGAGTSDAFTLPAGVLNVRSPLPRSFLPRSLLRALTGDDTSTSSSVDKLLSQLHIEPNSLLGLKARETLDDFCTGKSEGVCVQSVEDLADLVASKFPKTPARVLTSSFPDGVDSSLGGPEFRVVSVDLESDTKADYQLCHSMITPQEFLFCHEIPDSKVYIVTLESTEKKGVITKSVVVCHMDTSTWSPEHFAFYALGSRPGETNACHPGALDAFAIVAAA